MAGRQFTHMINDCSGETFEAGSAIHQLVRKAADIRISDVVTSRNGEASTSKVMDWTSTIIALSRLNRAVAMQRLTESASGYAGGKPLIQSKFLQWCAMRTLRELNGQAEPIVTTA